MDSGITLFIIIGIVVLVLAFVAMRAVSGRTQRSARPKTPGHGADTNLPGER